MAAALAFGSIGSRVTRQPMYTFHYENVLGTSMEVRVGAPSPDRAEAAADAALAEIRRQSNILSGYDPQSEFSRWTRTRDRAVPVSPELFELLGMWDEWRDRTGGALDASAETVGALWKKAEAEGRIPSPAEIRAAVDTVRQKHWTVDAPERTATHTSDAPLMLNSFTKSWVVDRAAEAAAGTEGVSAVVLNIGGDLVVRGSTEEPINIADPLSDSENSRPAARILVRDRAVATSGNYRRGFEIGGRHYSHIVDPRTGMPVEDVVSATVVAPAAVDAGALATAFSVLAPQESRKLAESIPGAEYLIIRRNGSRIASPGWHAMELPITSEDTAAAPVPFANSFAAAPQAAGTWNSNFELSIELELARIQGFGARRPYVAIWVEDKDHFPLRTLALWFDKTRWLPEMHAWYRSDRLRGMAEGTDITSTVSSATRPPGKYTFKWDGKDNAGKTVKPGKYTVFIEVAREHGSYQLLKQEIDFNGQPFEMQFAPNQEIAAASVDYHKVAH